MSTPPTTRNAILDTAERLFAAQGFDATSLRQLTTDARVNLAAVHYHFGSKEGLIAAVFARRLEPINRERMARLAALETGHGGTAVPLEELLVAFFEPVVQRFVDPGGEDVLRLFGRLHSEPTESRAMSLFLEQFRALRERFLPMLAAVLPRLPQRDLYWRTHFMLGAMAHTLACPDGLRLLSDGTCDARDPHESLSRLVAFAAAGLRAPVGHPEPAEERRP